jgi:hypothetical protein
MVPHHILDETVGQPLAWNREKLYGLIKGLVKVVCNSVVEKSWAKPFCDFFHSQESMTMHDITSFTSH